MLISFKHNYIYFRPKKTGSSVIASILRDSFGEKDIRAHDPGPGKALEKVHTEASEIKKMVSEEFWNGAFKFASERHPYEKAVSLAFYRYGKRVRDGRGKALNFEKVLDKVIETGSYSGFKYYSIDGKSVADDFIRHENFEADLRRICAKLGVPVPDELPRKKSNFRKDPRPAREILSDAQKSRIYETCKPEFELFGYER
ncbi:MAG TPA: hypothetical protein VG843_02665 [Rhizomicrobium sp.]|jgi:hypothetical protein|nr:hypothetical protein [Rhizomicrobium sp.]